MAGRRKFTFPASAFDAAATSCPAMVRIDNDADLARHAEADGGNLSFVGSLGQPIKATIGYTPVLLEDVTTTVASEPNAYHWANAAGTIDRTFIGAFRHQAGAGDLVQYDHLTGQMNVYRLAAAGTLDADDHNAVTVTVNETTGTVFAFVVDHNTDQMRVFRSSSPGDASTMVEITATVATDTGDIFEAAYPQPMWVGDRLYLSWRDQNGVGGYKRFVSWTDDNGDSWATRKEFIAGTGDRPYVSHDAFDSDRFEVYSSRGLERESSALLRDLFHFYVVKSTHNVYTTAGVLVGNLNDGPIDLDSATPILTQASQGGFPLRVRGICRDTRTGEIAIGYNRVHLESQSDPWESDYGQLRWDGTSWTAEIVATGQETLYGPTTEDYPGYLPGWTQSRYNLDECLGSFYASDRTLQIRKATRISAGSWSYQNLTSAHEAQVARPVYVRNAHEDLQIIFIAGAYDKFDVASTDMSLCAWPNVAAYGRLRALLELDHDGSTDQSVHLVVGDSRSLKLPAMASALFATSGDVGRRTLAKTSDAIVGPDNTIGTMHALAGLTVLAASNFSGHNTDETIISNYGAGGSATDRIMQMRYSNSSPARLECVVNFSTSSSTASEATDITLTSGVKYGMGFSWDGAAGSNHLRMASNGTLSSVAGTASGTLRNPSPSPRLRTGIRSGAGYDDTVQVFGPIDGVVILPEAKPTDWLRMATRGIGAPAYTVGEFVESSAPQIVLRIEGEKVRRAVAVAD